MPVPIIGAILAVDKVIKIATAIVVLVSIILIIVGLSLFFKKESKPAR